MFTIDRITRRTFGEVDLDVEFRKVSTEKLTEGGTNKNWPNEGLALVGVDETVL